jgi:hypothetical protein
LEACVASYCTYLLPCGACVARPRLSRALVARLCGLVALCGLESLYSFVLCRI